MIAPRFSLGVLCLAAMAGAVACGGRVPAAPEPSETARTAPAGVGADEIIDADAKEWLTHGRTYSEQRFSPLDKINRDNVGSLGLAWTFDLEASRGIEATPIVHDGVMYVTGNWNLVFALDARTGAEIWRYDPEIDRTAASVACCDIVNRGVALWDDKVFTGTIDGRLIAIDAKTGTEVWDVLTVDRKKPYTITGAPRVVKGKVIIGNGGAEYGVRGYVTAYDASTGAIVWRFYTVPGDPKNGYESDAMRKAAATWSGEWWKAGGGGTVWDSIAYDPALDLLYIGVGNGSPWNQSLRSPGGGDNLFLASIVALRPDTGEYVWHYQTTPGETWDYTATQHMILADITVNGAPRKVLMQAPKNGFFYVIDRETGELLSANNFVPINWATHVDMETGRPVEVPEARWPGKAPYLQLPGTLGAHNWQPMSFSPETGLVYIPAQETPIVFGDENPYEYKPGFWNVGSNFILASLPTDEATADAVRAMLKGRLIAWDPATQKQVWSVEYKGPWNGGVLSTAGGLVFQGTADAQFAAYDAATGAKLWSKPTQTGVVAAPIAYEIDGEQYVAVAAGWGGVYALVFGGLAPPGSVGNVGRVLVFKLGGSATLPPIEAKSSLQPALPAMTASAEVLAAGFAAYAQRCLVCHGDRAHSYGALPDLRYSPVLADADEWRAIVVDGARAEKGMASFATAFDPDTAEAIRAYVLSEATASR